MTSWSVFIAVVLSALVSCASLGLLIPRLNRRLLDYPNGRSSHSRPTPRGGGVVFVLLSTVSSSLALLIQLGHSSVHSPLSIVPLCALPLALVGFVDDSCNLPATWRYSVQLLTGLLIVLACPLLSLSIYMIPVLVLLVVSVTAVINFTNFMDGLDGLVGGCMVVSLSAMSIQLGATWPICALIGALLGFLYWNWSPAKVFMGDVGSTFLGAVSIGFVLQASTWPQALSLLLLCTPLLGDAFVCVLRRLMAGHNVFQAHRLHLYQRLYQAGWPHSRVSILYIAATVGLVVAQIGGGLPCVATIAALELIMGAWLDQKVAVNFSIASFG